MKNEDIKNLSLGDTVKLSTLAGIKEGIITELEHTYSKECAWVRIDAKMPPCKTLVNQYNGELIRKHNEN